MFGKKEENNTEEHLTENDLPPRRKFRDLRPENKRNRKEPLKPWGKRERILVGGVLVFTLLTSGVLAAMARDWKLPGLPRIILPKLSGFSWEGTVVIEADKNLPDFSKVENAFLDATNDLSGVYGFYVIELETGYSYGVNESEIYTAASLIKLPVFITLYQLSEEGKIDLDVKYTLKSEDQAGGSGSLQGKIGSTYTYRDLAKYMGQQSDNTAYKALRKVVGDERINQVIAEIGMKNTSLEENETTLEDVGILFKKLVQGELVKMESKDEILEFLTGTIYENHLAKGIPEGVRVAHKYGREVHVVNDAGIVFADRGPYVVVIMSKGVVESQADEVFPSLSKLIHDFEESF